MIKNKLHYMVIIIAIIIISCIYTPVYTVMASGASVWFETDQEVVREGDVIQIYMCIDSDDTLGDFEGFISYNDDVLEYVSGPACITGGSGKLEINDTGASGSWDTRRYAMKFKALKIGNSLIQIINTPTAYEYETMQQMSVSSSVYFLEIKAAIESSTNAKLAIINIVQGGLTPGFSGDIFEYQMIVGSDVEKLGISAIPEDISSDVKVTGNTSFKEGENKVLIIVTSPSGEELIYTINVFKETEEKEPVPTSGEAEENIPEWRFGVYSDNGTILLKGQYYYKVKDKPTDITIPDGYYKTRMIINKIPITVYAKSEDEAAEFYLLILENEAGESSLYRYDRIEKTIQRYVSDHGSSSGSAESSKLEEQKLLQDAMDLVKYQQNVSRLSLLTAICCAISVFLLVAVIVLFVKLKRKDNDDFNY